MAEDLLKRLRPWFTNDVRLSGFCYFPGWGFGGFVANGVIYNPVCIVDGEWWAVDDAGRAAIAAKLAANLAAMGGVRRASDPAADPATDPAADPAADPATDLTE